MEISIKGEVEEIAEFILNLQNQRKDVVVKTKFDNRSGSAKELQHKCLEETARRIE